MPTERKPMKPFKIFRPGKHTAACGTVVEFTEQQLLDAVKVYSPTLYATPMVIGHPKQEDRAYGWAASLSYSDGHLWVNPEHVEPQFAELVEQKAFRNRSASWYMPDHPNNPSPGNLYPKHIGFLGAVPPSLKGLGDIQFTEQAGPVDFAEDPHPELVLEFADMTTEERWSMSGTLSSMARAMRNWRDAILAEKGLEEADKLIPSWQIEDAEREAIRMQERARQDANNTPAYNEHAGSPGHQVDTTATTGDTTMTPAEIEALKRQNEEQAQRLAQFNERETSLKAAEAAAKLQRIDAGLQPHIDAGRILPAQRAQVAAFMATLDDGAQVVEFGEAPAAGQAVPKVSALAFMEGFLGQLPKAVELKERSNADKGAKTTITQREFSEKITAKVSEAQAKGQTLSFSQASLAVAAEFDVTGQDGTPNV